VSGDYHYLLSCLPSIHLFEFDGSGKVECSFVGASFLLLLGLNRAFRWFGASTSALPGSGGYPAERRAKTAYDPKINLGMKVGLCIHAHASGRDYIKRWTLNCIFNVNLNLLSEFARDI
jgi:hypothetical protein